MKVVVQRSLNSSVSVNNKVVGKIDYGFVLLVGFKDTDTVNDVDNMVKKIINLRSFADENHKMNRSIMDVKGSILSISQFTLYAILNGRRPSYVKTMNSSDAKKLYDIFNEKLREYVKVETGIFGADMKVNIVNDGPVSIIIESGDKDDKES